MTWVTKKRIKVNRAATAWLIRRFIDPDATILFVEPEAVAELQRRESATGFDAPGTTYPNQDAAGHCSCEALVAKHCANDPAVVALARIVQGADFREQIGIPPESAGLRTISDGFPLVAGDDHETVERAAFLYDALYASLRERLGLGRTE